jgi:hypothetical protein
MGRRLLAVALLIPLALLISGCKDPYGASVKAGADVADGVAQGLKTVLSLQQQGTITSAEAISAAGYFEFANKADEAYLSCVSTAHANGNKPGTYTACIQSFNTTLNNPQQLVLIHVKDASASQTITTIVNGLATGLTSLQTALGGA